MKWDMLVEIAKELVQPAILAIIAWGLWVTKKHISSLKGTIQALEKRIGVPERLVVWYEERTLKLQEAVEKAESETNELRKSLQGLPGGISARAEEKIESINHQIRLIQHQLVSSNEELKETESPFRKIAERMAKRREEIERVAKAAKNAEGSDNGGLWPKS